MGKRWTEQEIEFLNGNYGGKSNRELSKELGRKLSGIQHKSIQLNLKKPKEAKNKRVNGWKDEEIEILKKYYKTTPNDKILKMLPNKNLKTIGQKANRMGLIKSYSTQGLSRINLDENKIIELSKIGVTKKQIAEQLSCSKSLIGKRYIELGIKSINANKKLNLDNEKIKELYESGENLTEISEMFNCSIDSISSRLRKQGIKIRNRGQERMLPKHEQDKIINLYKEGNSIYDIEEKIGEGYWRIFYLLKKNGIKLRERVEANKLDWKKNPTRGKVLREKALIRFKDEEFLKNYSQSINRKPNKPETVVIELIKENNLPFNYVGDGQVWLGGFNPDFLSKNPKHIIEVFGNYWHNKDDKMIERDKRRIEAYSKLGYKTLIIWESELKNKEKVLNKIRSFLI